jgi:hypothetical protein
VRVPDFIIPELGRANPCGVYDLARNQGWVSVGTDHDTAAFAVSTIRRWWTGMGAALYPKARRLLITAGGGGSPSTGSGPKGNGSRNRLWKRELQALADDTGLRIEVSHLPPGTSHSALSSWPKGKWNKIEHRRFSFISQNWRGKPLTSHEVIVQLIAATSKRKGLRVHAELDPASDRAGTKVSDEEMAKLRLELSAFHGGWNYALRPKRVRLNATLLS